jgi:predicted Fe-Mo cluster-binding NifX family protein
MGLRVAVATDDGVVVQRFGHATRFHVYDLDREKIVLVERRKSGPSSVQGEAQAEDRALDVLRDCQALVVARVGAGALLRLIEARGMAVYESQAPVASVLRDLAVRGSSGKE